MWHVQRELYLLTSDGYSPHTFTSGLVNTEDNITRWQAAVDTLYRFAVCGLIWSTEFEGDSLLSYIDELATWDPYPPNDLPPDCWIMVEFFATTLTHELIDRSGWRQSDGCHSDVLDGELRSLFSKHGVPFDTYPVKPIVR